MFSDHYKVNSDRAVKQLHDLIKSWVDEGFTWTDVRMGLMQFGGLGDDAMDEFINEFFPDVDEN